MAARRAPTQQRPARGFTVALICLTLQSATGANVWDLYGDDNQATPTPAPSLETGVMPTSYSYD
jgi:hypothetical protein